MRKQLCIITSAMTLGVGTAALMAQAAGGSAPQAASKVTITGCVERADQVLQRATLGTTVDSLTFILIKAEDSKNTAAAGSTASHREITGGTPTGTSGAAASKGPEDLGKMYQLDAEVEKLNEHVGHRVEIVGSVAAAANTPAPTGPSGAAAGNTDQSTVPMLKVDSVKMISATCPR